MIVELTDEAEQDLERIADRIAEDNPLRAISFVEQLRLNRTSAAQQGLET
jgi:plasmid stabilization system protein ParE